MTKKIRIKIDPERCKGCLFCLSVCNFKVLALSDKVNKKGMTYVTVALPDECRGCGLCAMMCPECCIEITEE